ncbi:molybdopterin-binding protein [Desulfobacter postgatei]|uniref:Molybdopterin molybdenumtransferase n=1 Tax=Desulfobacter postgatei 2ac9 TaxID=879212 RepID=I5B2N9_9BACT|nr:molybdopterin-binding protein [Desulfobacter postgatei]EIM63752.1 molybdopterin biosynthesis enzyme [Desulfobacter postgatei 2ac9]
MKYYEKDKATSVPVQEAVGKVLLHDITRIVPDLFKGPQFKKGHVITMPDVKVLLDMGKEHIYVTGLDNEVHENEAALCIARAATGRNIRLSEPQEGKVSLSSQIFGLLKVNVDALFELNSIQDVIFATLHNRRTVQPEEELAGTRVVPLTVPKERLETAEAVCRKYYPVIEVTPFKRCDVGVVVTGSEVFHQRIRDGFGPVVSKKFERLGSRILKKKVVSDDMEMTVTAIRDLLDNGADFIAVTGGMSVDPDDLTPAAIRAAGGRVVTYGAPVLPGAMFMLAYIGDVPVVGLPGCVMYYRTSIFDLVVPPILAGETLEREDIVRMGHGGFCANCSQCRFPACSFGK